MKWLACQFMFVREDPVMLSSMVTEAVGMFVCTQVRLVTALETVLASPTPSRIVFTASHAEGGGRMNWKNLT